MATSLPHGSCFCETLTGGGAQKMVWPHIDFEVQVLSPSSHLSTWTVPPVQAGIAWHWTCGFAQKIEWPHIEIAEQSLSPASHLSTCTVPPEQAGKA
jgi:hypothetical protein